MAAKKHAPKNIATRSAATGARKSVAAGARKSVATTRKKSATPAKAPLRRAGPKPATIDAYLAALPPKERVALANLRKQIRAVAPNATESISYGIAAFKQDGMLVGFGASAKHLSFYLMSTAIMTTHAADLEGHPTGKGTVHFTPSEPLPAALVKKLVKARLKENRER